MKCSLHYWLQPQSMIGPPPCLTVVLFMKFCALCSPNIALLIVAKEFYFNLIGPQNLFLKCIRLV